MSYNLYGISDIDIAVAQLKYDKQLEYLKSNVILTNTGQFKSFEDISLSANFSKRYYAEVANRTNTIYSLAQDFKLKPVFLTITLNGCFRDALKGDFSRFTSKDRILLPNLLKLKIQRNEAFTIRDLVFVLNYQWDIFSSRQVFRGIKKMYIRTFEPHKKDGVPHIHALLYIPSNIIPKALETFKDVFNATMNITQNPNRLTSEQIKNGEINGFQWTLNNPTGYVMKYIQKTFINLQEKKQLDNLSSWYVIHKVRRFITSRSTIPLWVYRKIFFIEKDLHTLTEMLTDKNSIIEWDFDLKYIRFSNSYTMQELEYKNGYYEYKINGRVINKKELEKSYKTSLKPTFTKKDNKLPKYVPVFQNDSQVGFYNGYRFTEKLKPMISKFTDLELFNYFKDLDIEDVSLNLHHYVHVNNELVKRGFYGFEKMSFDSFNTDFDIEDILHEI